jgi:hypothetical protein
MTSELWIGLIGVRKLEGCELLANEKGAYVNVITWAREAEEFKGKVKMMFETLKLFVDEVENAEPVRLRQEFESFDEEIADLISRAEENPNAILYGTFHSYLRDDA